MAAPFPSSARARRMPPPPAFEWTLVPDDHRLVTRCQFGVNYLQALEVKGSDETREREVARMARGLKGLALDLNVPVLALAQLNRGADQRDEPRLSDLRESGAIEQYADNVLLLYARSKDEPGVVTAKIAKQRNGPRDLHCRLWFDGALFRFRNLAGGGR